MSKSINKDVKILLIENSKNFKDEKFFIKKFKNLKVICSGSNLGMGNGNNYGLSKVKTPFAMVLNPDASCAADFLKI